MSEIPSLHYYALGINKNPGSTNETGNKKANKNSENKKAEQNKEQAITENEFKEKYNNKESVKYWDTYTSFYNVYANKEKNTPKKPDNSTSVNNDKTE